MWSMVSRSAFCARTGFQTVETEGVQSVRSEVEVEQVDGRSGKDARAPNCPFGLETSFLIRAANQKRPGRVVRVTD